MSSNTILTDTGNGSILIIDNDVANLRDLKKSLTARGIKVHVTNEIAAAYRILNSEYLTAILGELQLKQGNTLDLFKRFKEKFSDGQCYLMSEHALKENSLALDRVSVDYYFQKPVDLGVLAGLIEKTQKRPTAGVQRLDRLSELLRPYLVFRSPVMRQGLMILPKVASTGHSVLITGETGTGKEMVARAIHALSPYSNGPFIAVNCGAIPENLIEGELFGHEKGAFTGAQTSRKGKFELAQNGTLFLDEMGEMPLALQARLLRVLEERQFYRIGGEKAVDINIRVVAATQVRLEKAVEDGLFREDLYYRLNVLRIHLPALRERLDDIPLLAWHFLERAFDELGRQKPYPILTDEIITVLKQLPWKGNVRELRNIITRLAVLVPLNIGEITPDYLEAYFPEKFFSMENMAAFESPAPDPPAYQEFETPSEYQVPFYSDDEGVFIPVGTPMKEVEDKMIEATLRYTKGNRTKAAKLLGIGIRTLRRKLNEQ